MFVLTGCVVQSIAKVNVYTMLVRKRTAINVVTMIGLVRFFQHGKLIGLVERIVTGGVGRNAYVVLRLQLMPSSLALTSESEMIVLCAVYGCTAT